MSLYDLLQIEPDASEIEITKAFHKLSKIYHPDKLDKNDENYEEYTNKYIELRSAYSILSDKNEREDYDRKNTIDEADTIFDPNKILNEMMNDQDDNVPDVWSPISCNIMEAYKGCSIEISYNRISICEKCNGNGTYDSEVHDCSKCEGRGSILDTINVDDKILYKESICRTCEGTGIDPMVKLCVKCKGDKYYKDVVETDIDVPSGVYKGYIIKEIGEGNFIFETDNTNDIKDKTNRTDVNYVIDHIDGNVSFEYLSKRQKRRIKKYDESTIITPEYFHGIMIRGSNKYTPSNLECEIDINFADALTGTCLNILHVSGDILEVKIDDVIINNESYVIPGKGLPIIESDMNKNIKDEEYGDLVLRFNVEKPELNSKQKNRLWQILTATPYKKRSRMSNPIECLCIQDYLELNKQDEQLDEQIYDEYDNNDYDNQYDNNDYDNQYDDQYNKYDNNDYENNQYDNDKYDNNYDNYDNYDEYEYEY